MLPGDVFTHRNIANIIHPGDINTAAVVEFAVGKLHVQAVVVCGHSGCGGADAAMSDNVVGGVLDTWLSPLRRIRRENWNILKPLTGEEARVKLVEMNVLAGVKTVKDMPVVQEAMRKGGLRVHGAVYDVGTGQLREIQC
jgi:carbonic anhydrase